VAPHCRQIGAGHDKSGPTIFSNLQGNLHNRSFDIILTAGYNVAGPEVENALLEHPAVAECAVVGMPDAQRGTIVKAFVVLESGYNGDEAMARTLQEFVKQHIAPYKYPWVIEFCDKLPRADTGKIQRYKLRQHEQGIANV
jgi:2-aminobenzoate-CoA ligase